MPCTGLSRYQRPVRLKRGFVGQAGNPLKGGNLDEPDPGAGAIRIHLLQEAVAAARGDLHEMRNVIRKGIALCVYATYAKVACSLLPSNLLQKKLELLLAGILS